MSNNEDVSMNLLKELRSLKADSGQNDRIAKIINGVLMMDTITNRGFRKLLMEAVEQAAVNYLLKNEGLSPTQRKVNDIKEVLLEEAEELI